MIPIYAIFHRCCQCKRLDILSYPYSFIIPTIVSLHTDTDTLDRHYQHRCIIVLSDYYYCTRTDYRQLTYDNLVCSAFLLHLAHRASFERDHHDAYNDVKNLKFVGFVNNFVTVTQNELLPRGDVGLRTAP